MGRQRKSPMYVIVEASPLCCIGPDRILDFEVDADQSLANELDCPVADTVLVALRKIFSLTFSENPFIDGIEKAVTQIRKLGVEALIEIPQILEDLKLSPIPKQLSTKNKVHVFRYFFVKDDDLKIQIKFEGKRRSLYRLLNKWPGDELVSTLRDVITETFSEIYDEEQAVDTLRRIRSKIWEVLPKYNDVLIDIEIEPMPVFIDQMVTQE